ncbi:MAG: two-component system histidine kinase PnpS [Bacillota bacterium]
MKKKIFLFYMVLIVIGVSVTGFFTSQLARKFYKYEVEQSLINTALLIRYQLLSEFSKGRHVDYNDLAKEYSGILNRSDPSKSDNRNVRITFIDFNGNVVGESNTNYKEMENHLDRKEVKEAVNGKIGKGLRFSKTLGYDFEYVAVPIESHNMVVRVSVPLTQLNNIENIIFIYSVIGIVSGLIITAVLALRFSHSITKPIIEIISASKEIASGNYSKRVKIKSRDELNDLSKAFNEMALKLERTIADLKDKNIKVDTIINSMQNGIVAVDNRYKILLINSIACDMFGVKNNPKLIGMNILNVIRNNQLNNMLNSTITSNKTLISEAVITLPEDKVFRIYTNPIKSKDKINTNLGGIAFIQDITNIKKLEQIRTEFVSNVTHELKTPLTSIRGFIETLRNGAIEDKKVAYRFLEIIDIEAERLYVLINDILQLSEIETKHVDSNIDTYNLKSIVDETVSILQPVAEKKGVTLNSEVDKSINLKVNRDRIKQLLINLIDNGIKYNREIGSVSVSAYKLQGKVLIRIKDSGIGIDKEHLPRIFERFYRVDKGRSRNMGGTGLGLSIVKHVVNLYNGDIKVISEPGKGTEFIIQFPA